MKIHDVIIYDDYNSRLVMGGAIGTITPQSGTTAIRNGYKLIEIQEIEDGH